MLSLVALTSACATSLRSPHVADIRYNPGRYQNQTVSINGVVTNSWGGPFIPVSYYKIDDGTGEMTVLSQGGRRLPSRGEHVRVRGRVNEVAVLNGLAFGLHLREDALYVKGR